MKVFKVLVLVCLLGIAVGKIPIPHGCSVFDLALNGYHLPFGFTFPPLLTIKPVVIGRRFILGGSNPLHLDMSKIFNVSTSLVYDSVRQTLPASKEISHTCRIGIKTTSQKEIDFVKAMMNKYKVCTICDEFDSNTTTCNTVGFCPQGSICYRGDTDDRKYWPKSTTYNIFDAMHPKAGFHGCCLATDRKCRYHRYVVKNKNNNKLNTANYTIHTCTSTACNGNDRLAVSSFVSKLTKVDGHWTHWGQWSHCSHTCGGGTKTRTRTCSNPKPAGGGRNCIGPSSSSTHCTKSACPVDGLWASWGPWGQCSVTCGDGTKARNRTCTNPAPSSGGKACVGSLSEKTTCRPKSCPVNGHWTSWGHWGHCSATCGGGTKYRHRTCTHPAPSNGGKTCSGSSTLSGRCATTSCPVNGHWNHWQSWGSCSVTCGHGTKKRIRTCSHVLFGGKTCSGSSSMSTSCGRPCSIDGHWSSWHTWGTCSVTCGHGTETRVRTCSNPQPAYRGKDCVGSTSDARQCGQPCKIDGSWTSWHAWGTCSVTCGDGQQSRARTCSNPTPANGGKQCVGGASQSRHCGDPCKVDGHWGNWHAWGSCSVTCGHGKKTRTRTCSNPRPAYGGKECIGDASQNHDCGKPCIINGGWTEWQVWSKCSKSCASGTRSRGRTCTNPAPANGGTDCSGSKSVTEGCNADPCPHWSRWFYDACSVSCGNGTTMRLRHCSSGKDADCGAGKAFENVGCSEQPCPVDGSWGKWNAWSKCTATCGEGQHTRSRSCNNPSPQNGGAVCNGSSDETAVCNTQGCPHWLPFEKISSCSVTCGKGFLQLKRNCSTGIQSDCTGSAYNEKACVLDECV